MRPTMSEAPPGANGTTMRTALEGYASAQNAFVATVAARQCARSSARANIRAIPHWANCATAKKLALSLEVPPQALRHARSHLRRLICLSTSTVLSDFRFRSPREYPSRERETSLRDLYRSSAARDCQSHARHVWSALGHL